VDAFAWRAASLTFDVQKKRDDQKMEWNDLLIDFYRVSKAHAQYMVVKNFYDTIESESKKGQVAQEILTVLRSLFRLFSLSTLMQEASEFTATGACSERQIALARDTAEQKLLKEIRPHAVRLVDSWAFDDFLLDSSLGRYDGKVYEDMFYRASELNPLNRITVDPYPESPVLYKKIEGKDPRSKL
jgi:acyl-CoA oxidase